MHPHWVPNCIQNLKGGWKFSFPKMFDSYRDLFLITWLISVREESSFFNFFPVLSPGSPSSVSLEKSVVCGLLLSEGRAFPFFTWFCLSWVVSPIWAVVIWRQNLSFFFHLVLSLLGSQSCLGCCYLKAEPFPFFHLVLSLLGSQSYLDFCYLKAKSFLFFIWFCLSLGVVSF